MLISLINIQFIKKLLVEGKVDINYQNDIGEAPLHTLVRRASQKGGAKKNAETFGCLWNYMVYCDKFDINIRSEQGWETALHIAAEVSVAFYILTQTMIYV